MFTCTRTDSTNTDFKMLVNQLDRYLMGINGDDHDFFDQFNKIDNIRHVVVLYLDGQPAGCGAIKEYEPGVMEVKRMFVPPAARGKGLATAILKELEVWAAELGYEKCILETGDIMPDAIALYKKNGYRSIPNYGQYVDVASSVCFEKHLAG
ncbi:MAG TPA: GNAT family N-acetyltransferase [Chitinophagaceae bacterium]|jgi:putative acetyltransferase|nr:GNAT family N-acetyltransferase [Chitinophagaceae bacterium]HPH31925.1 GNAT family N-acetyltransferase [Chitinophagaceae bacterium]HPN60377.1 GNAT family N-acetyltransferase [Chitinophagaceae bacterium]